MKMMKRIDRGTAIVRLALTGVLSVLFAAYAWLVFDAALFIAWEPNIPGCEEYYSWNGYSFALWNLFVALGWITFPLLALICLGWFTGLSSLKHKQEVANNGLHGRLASAPP